MRILPILALFLSMLPARADLSFDIRLTRIAHPSLGLKTRESVVRVMTKGPLVATLQNDIVQVVDAARNIIVLIDYRTKTFASSNLDEVQRKDDLGYDSLPQGIRSQVVSSGVPATWNGVAVKRDLIRVVMSGGDAPGEILATSDWVENAPRVEESGKALETADQRHTQEVEAEIQTMVLEHPERFADLLKMRKENGHSGFEIHSLKEVRLAPNAPMLEAIGPEDRKRPILSEETELINMSASDVDPAVFLVPKGFNPVDFGALLAENYNRRHF